MIFLDCHLKNVNVIRVFHKIYFLCEIKVSRFDKKGWFMLISYTLKLIGNRFLFNVSKNDSFISLMIIF